MHHNKKVYSIIVIALGIGCIISGLTAGLYYKELSEKMLKDSLELTPSSESFELWSHTPVPLYMEVYLFNWTNAEEFAENKKVVPNFEEVGPFVFSEVQDKVNLKWNDNHTVTYNQIRKWNFIPELSEDLSVEVTNLNVIGTTLSQVLKKFSRFKSVLNWLFRTENLAITAPAKNWIFEGIDDKLLEYVSELEHMFNIPTPKTKFAWFYERNMSSTYDGTFTVHTGTDDINKVGMLDMWNGMNQSGIFDGICGKINGSTGELYPPMKSMRCLLDIFISDMCSSIRLYPNGSTIMNGVRVHKYVGDKYTFDNGQFNPARNCNCIDECVPYGVRDVSTCKKAPLYFSFPHFYQADESYLSAVSGLMPDENEHQFMIVMDPRTGMPYEVRAQLQINVRVEPVPWLKAFSDVPEMYVPMMWFRQRAKITRPLATKTFWLHFLPEAIVGSSYILLGLGCLITIVRLFMIWRLSKKTDDSELLIPPMMSEDENVHAK